LNLEIIPAERGPERPDFVGDPSEKAAKGKEALEEIMRLAGFEATVHLVQDDAEEIHFDLRGADEARIIGKKGDVLLSLQFILNRIVGRDSEEEQVLVLDAANYRSRRRDALASLAKRLADRAIAEGKAVRLSPMSAHDRRVFHLTLKEVEEVDTRSEGDGLYRNLLIIPAEYA
jgi:spoIIIJ-associated protein